MMAVDRISNLPEGLIIEVLSRMETQYAVRTCVLSKRWTRLWTQLACFDFNFDSFDSLDSFRVFLLGLFTHYDSSKLYSLRFVFKDDDGTDYLDDRIVETMIDYATVNRVGQLWINCASCCWKDFKLPLQLLTCLDELSLESLSIKFPKPSYSATLRTISLECVHVENDILLSCMNLENFIMSNCGIGGLSKIVIDAPKLVDLHMDFEWVDEDPGETMVSISAPKLESILFSFDCHSILKISLDRCPTLESAWIDFYSDAFENTNDMLEKRSHAVHLVKFLKDLSDARSLTFSAGTIKVLSAFPDLVKNLPSPFHKLKSLKVFRDMKNKSVVIPPEVGMFLVGGSENGSELLIGLQSE